MGGGAVETEVGDVVKGEFGLDEVEKGGELGEDYGF